MTIDFSKSLAIKQKTPNEFETKVLGFIDEWYSESETLAVQTSGSTGKPKIFEIEKQKMLNSAEMTCNFLGLKEQDSALLCLPVEYISGKMMIVRSILKKLKLRIAEPDIQPLKNLEKQIDFCAMTPLQVENSLEKIHLVKNLIIGGATVSEALKKKILKMGAKDQKSRIYETYGMSETLSHIALKQVFPTEEDWFTVLENVNISLNKNGCLKIFAPKLNSQVLQTNDLVEIKNEKQFRFIGRIDNVINSGGAKIFPEELENFVKQHISNEVVFIGVKDETLGQKLILVIEEVKAQKIENLKSMICNLKFQKSFHRPKEIMFVEKIPRTENGKVDRLQLVKIINSK